MLQNAYTYFLAKIGADTAEKEQHFAENLPKIGNYPTGPPARFSSRSSSLQPGTAPSAAAMRPAKKAAGSGRCGARYAQN